MHELSIAEAVLAIAQQHAGERRITQVEVRVGELRQVVPDALSFAFQLLCEGTSAEGAELAISEVPVTASCIACAAVSRQQGFPMGCTSCGGVDLRILSGEELYVESIEVSEEQPLSEVVI